MKVFKLLIDMDDETGLTFNALVDRPAHNKSLIAFGKDDKRELHFNDDKRMITGVAISANQLIYRFDNDLGEYYVYFEPKEIEKMVLKMSRQKLLSSVNLMHDSRKVVNDITFVEGYFVSDSKRPPKDDENVQNGSYVMTYYVENEALYNQIKGGKYVGFSVEGIFDQIPVKIKSNINHKPNKMKKGSFWKFVFGKEKFAEATTTDGVVLMYEGDLAEGTAVFIADEEGNQVAAPEGSYTLEDGTTVEVDANGIVTAVTEPTEEPAPEEMSDDVSLSEVAEVLKELNSKFESLSGLADRVDALEKGEVKGKKKFERKDGPTWKEMLDKGKKEDKK